jgi:hypothetical protein
MAANVPNAGLFLQAVGSELTSLRDAFQKLVDRNDYIASMGGKPFLIAPPPDGIGMSSGDADALLATLGNHKNLATHYGGGAQAAAMNYRANGQPFWGGQ